MKKIILSAFGSLLLFSNLNADTKLNDVLITAKTASEVLDTAGSFSVLTKEDIKLSNASSLQTILEETVGINISANNRSINGRKNITFRGMNPEHTAILINGKRISNTDAQIGHSDFQYNWIPLSAISRVEIIRGPMSSLYGSKALGGVVNIITNKPLKDFEGSLNIKYSRQKDTKEGQEKDFSIVLAGNINEKLALSVFAQKNVLDDIDNKKGIKSTNPNVSQNESEFEGKDISNAMLNLWYTIDDTQEISASLLKGNEKRDAISMDLFPTMKKAIETNNMDIVVNNYFKELYNIDKEHYSLSYDKYFDFGSFNIKVYTTKSDVHSDSFKFTHKLKDEVLASEFILDKIDRNYLVFGVDLKKESYKKDIDRDGVKLPLVPVRRKNFKDEVEYKSFYFQDEIEINDKTLLTLGARYDKHEKFGGELSPKAYILYKLSQNQRLKTGYGRGFNAPTLTQLSDEYTFSNPSAGHSFIGNSKLKPEISDTYEVGYEFNNNINIFKTTFFYSELKDLISTKESNLPVNSGGFYEQYSNINSASLKGIEVEYEKIDLLKDLDFNFYYTYLYTKDKEKNRELNFRPEHKINTSFKYNFDKTLFANLSFAYIGKQKNYNDREKEKTDMEEYLTSKIQISKDFMENLNLRFGIENLTNKQLHEDYNYQLKPRTYYLNLSYNF